MNYYTFSFLLLAVARAIWYLFSNNTINTIKTITVHIDTFHTASSDLIPSILLSIDPPAYYFTKAIAIRLTSALAIIPSFIKDLAIINKQNVEGLKEFLVNLFRFVLFVVVLLCVTAAYWALTSDEAQLQNKINNDIPNENFSNPSDIHEIISDVECPDLTPDTPSPSPSPQLFDNFQSSTNFFGRPTSDLTTNNRQPSLEINFSTNSSNFGCSEPSLTTPVTPCSYVSAGPESKEEEGPEKLMQMFWAPDDPRLKIEISPPVYSPPPASASPVRSCFKKSNESSKKNHRTVQFIRKTETFFIDKIEIPSPPPQPKTKIPSVPANYTRDHEAIRLGLYFGTGLPIPSRCLASGKFHHNEEEQ